MDKPYTNILCTGSCPCYYIFTVKALGIFSQSLFCFCILAPEFFNAIIRFCKSIVAYSIVNDLEKEIQGTRNNDMTREMKMIVSYLYI